MLSAPAEKTIVEQAEETLASAKEQATVAVSAANQKLLEVAGAKSNTELLTTLQQQGESYVTQVKGKRVEFVIRKLSYRRRILQASSIN